MHILKGKVNIWCERKISLEKVTPLNAKNMALSLIGHGSILAFLKLNKWISQKSSKNDHRILKIHRVPRYNFRSLLALTHLAIAPPYPCWAGVINGHHCHGTVWRLRSNWSLLRVYFQNSKIMFVISKAFSR